MPHLSRAVTPTTNTCHHCQVYEATLATGEDVVIKVQKPGVADTLKTDLGFVYMVSRLVELVNPEFSDRLSLSDIVGDIRK